MHRYRFEMMRMRIDVFAMAPAAEMSYNLWVIFYDRVSGQMGIAVVTAHSVHYRFVPCSI